MNKTDTGLFFEDFAIGQTLAHATPRTVTTGDVAFYQALYGGRFAVASSEPFAQALGYRSAPVDDLLAFHIVFGKSVPDISRNAIANLGYAEGCFVRPVYPGDTLTACSEVIGVKQNTSGETGVVYVRTNGLNQHGEAVLGFVRWVMVAKRDPATPAPDSVVPALPESVAVADLGRAVPAFDRQAYDLVLSGSRHRLHDYSTGERIDHVIGQTLEEAEHQLATRLYQNTAGVHFDALAQEASRFGRRIVYGGHVISLARALTFNGLGNAFHVAAINGGRHAAPVFAGDTLYAWSEVLSVADLPGRSDIGAMRLRTVALKNRTAVGYPLCDDDRHAPGVVLDLDYWVCLPK